MNDTIEINGETYRRVGGNNNIVVVRSRDAGVHVGTLVERNGNEVTLRNSVRIWRWRGANTLNEVATNGIESAAESNFTRVSDPIDEITIIGVCEVAVCSPKAWEKIKGAGWAK